MKGVRLYECLTMSSMRSRRRDWREGIFVIVSNRKVRDYS